MAMTAAQYLASLSPSEQANVEATLDPNNRDAALDAWFQAAIDAGDPRAVGAAGGGSAEEGGAYAEFTGASGADEWLGKRKPTPRELRKYGAEQHSKYLAGDASAQDEDYARFSDAQLAAWINEGWDPSKGGFFTSSGEKIAKPTDVGASGVNAYGESPGAGGSPGGAGGPGGGSTGTGGFSATTAGAPPAFEAPTVESVLNDPSYQFRLGEGLKAIQGSAAAKGTLRTGGTLKDLMNYGQGAASEEYGNAYNRALQGWQTKYQPWETMYGGDLSKWTTEYGGDLSKWQTKYGGDLQKYLQKEGQIYGLLNTPEPEWG